MCHHVHQLLNCQYYQYSTSIHYHTKKKHLNNYFTCQIIIRKWPLIAERCKRVVAEQQARYSDNQPRCGKNPQQLGLSNLSQHVAMRISLVAASTFCLSQTEHEIQNSTYCSQFKFSRCGENPTRCYEYSQRQGFTNPSLLIAARITPAAASAFCLKQPNIYSRANITIHHPYLLVDLAAMSTHSLLNNSIIN